MRKWSSPGGAPPDRLLNSHSLHCLFLFLHPTLAYEQPVKSKPSTCVVAPLVTTSGALVAFKFVVWVLGVHEGVPPPPGTNASALTV